MYFCSLALEEIVFNIIEYQDSIGEKELSIDVHIVLYGSNKMAIRVKDCSRERNPFVEYELPWAQVWETSPTTSSRS